jgi:hypothetical protein
MTLTPVKLRGWLLNAYKLALQAASWLRVRWEHLLFFSITACDLFDEGQF